MKNVEQQHNVPPKNFLDYGPTREKLDTKEPLRALRENNREQREKRVFWEHNPAPKMMIK